VIISTTTTARVSVTGDTEPCPHSSSHRSAQRIVDVLIGSPHKWHLPDLDPISHSENALVLQRRRLIGKARRLRAWSRPQLSGAGFATAPWCPRELLHVAAHWHLDPVPKSHLFPRQSTRDKVET
jgi:hypothetical protein